MPMHLGDIVAPVVVATLFIIATSAFKEPQRRHFNAIMIAGAGAAYLNGGLGIWEFAFTAVVTYCAYKGLTLLLDSGVVDVPRSSNPIVVNLSSLKPLFFNGLQ